MLLFLSRTYVICRDSRENVVPYYRQDRRLQSIHCTCYLDLLKFSGKMSEDNKNAGSLCTKEKTDCLNIVLSFHISSVHDCIQCKEI